MVKSVFRNLEYWRDLSLIEVSNLSYLILVEPSAHGVTKHNQMRFIYGNSSAEVDPVAAVLWPLGISCQLYW